MSEVDRGPRRPATWLAALLNLVLPPLGYVYIGALGWAVAFVAMALAVGVGLATYSVLNPPGVLIFDAFGPLHVIGVAMNAAAAIHVGFLNHKVRARRKPGVLIAVGLLLWLAPFAAGLVGHFVAPIATYRTASSSMEPTLTEGDIILSNGARALCGRSEVRPGDVVYFRRQGVTYSQRLVAGPSDTVQVTAGRLIINGAPVKTTSLGNRSTEHGAVEIVRETLPNGVSYLTADRGESDLDNIAPIQVPDRHWFALGDNRDNAMDSRVWGPAPHSSVCGVAVRILSSSNADRIGARP